MISVLLADDNALMRKAIADLLKWDPEIELLAEAVNFSQTIELASKLHPQVVVMDLHMDDEKQVTPAQVKLRLVGSRLLTMSIWSDNETKALAESYGAFMVLDKTHLGTELIPAIKQYANERGKGSGADEPEPK
jgi:chemotaxis response regulator CheB